MLIRHSTSLMNDNEPRIKIYNTRKRKRDLNQGPKLRPCYVALTRLTLIPVPEGITTKEELKKWKRSRKEKMKSTEIETLPVTDNSNETVSCVDKCGEPVVTIIIQSSNDDSPDSGERDLAKVKTNSQTEDDNKQEGSAKRYVCSHCRSSYIFKQNFARHNAQRHDLKAKCTVRNVGRIFQKLKVKRWYYKHRHSIKKKCVYPCWKCSIMTYEDRRHLQQHLNAVLYKCTICGRAFTYEHKFRKHKEQCHHHQHEDKKEGSSELVCTICGRTFKRRSSVVRHYRKVHLL